jgi:hypothetical protein
MLIHDSTEVGQLRSLVGASGKISFAGKTIRCVVEAVLVESDGTKLVLRDEYNKKVKRSPSKFDPDEE